MESLLVKRYLKVTVFLLLAAFYTSLLTHKIDLPAADDLGRHLLNGSEILQGHFSVLFENAYSYTEPTYRFINHHWLFGVIVFLVQKVAGWGGLVVFKILVLLSAFSLLFLTALRKAPFWVVAVFSVPAILILSERTQLRPEIFSFLFIALFLYVLTNLETQSAKWAYWLVPVQIVWVNTHLFFFIGPTLVFIFLCAKILAERPDEHRPTVIRELSVLLFVLLMACLINPNGFAGALFPFQILHSYGIIVRENLPISYFLQNYPPLDNLPIRIFQLSFLLLCATSLVRGIDKKILSRQELIFYSMTSFLAGAGAFMMLRLLPLFGLAFLPAISTTIAPYATALQQSFERRVAFSLVVKSALVALFFATLCFGIFFGSTGRFSSYNKPGLGLTAQSEASAHFFMGEHLKGPIFNDFDIGSYLSYYLYPSERVFVDNRPEAYSPSFLAAYASMFSNEHAWDAALQQYDFNVIYVYQYSNDPNMRLFLYARVHDPAWALVYADRYAVMLVRAAPQNKEVIGAFHITSENAVERLQALTTASDPDEEAAAADVFSLLGLPAEEMKTLTHVVEQWPTKGKVWMLMGKRSILKDPPAAIRYLQQALTVGYTTAETYRYLGIAYGSIGDIEHATSALRRALRINPGDAQSQDVLARLLAGESVL